MTPGAMPSQSSEGPLRALWPLAIIAIGLLVRWLIVAENTSPLVSFVSDDSYYYYVPVRHLLNGTGLSFDGLTLTNGFHPLWFALLVPVFALVPGTEPPVIASLLLSGTLGALSAYPLWRAVRRITESEWAAGIILVLYTFNPYLVSVSLNGLETGLHLLCAATLLAWVAHLGPDQTPLSRRQAVLLGVLIGLTFLSRTDSVILLALVGLLLLRRGFSMRHLLPLAGAAIIAGLIALPWLAWNAVHFGTVLQSSGTSLTYFARNYFAAQTGGETPLPYLLALAAYHLQMALRWGGLSVPAMAALALPALWVILNRRRRQRLITPEAIRWLVLALSYVLLYIAFHSMLRWFMREWYFATVLLLLYLALGILVALALRIFPIQRAALSGLLLLLLMTGWLTELNNPAFIFWGRPEKYPGQFQMRDAATWLRESMSAEDRIGSFNAGIVAYYSERRVINLDGVMNYAVQPYIRDNRLLCYVAEADLDYLADFEGTFSTWRAILDGSTAIEPDTLWRSVYRNERAEQVYIILEVDKSRVRAVSGCQARTELSGRGDRAD